MNYKRKWIVVVVLVAIVATGLTVLAYNEYRYQKEQEEIALNMMAYHRGEIVHVAKMNDGDILLYVDCPGLNISGELQEYVITEESFVDEALMKELQDRKPGAYVEIKCYSTPRDGIVDGHSVCPVIDVYYYEP